MRSRTFSHLAVVTCFVFYVLFRLFPKLKALLIDTTPYLLSREELSNNGTYLIPKILHQVYLGWDHEPMPEHWKEPQRSCIDLHPDWEYKFWNNDSAYELLVNEYPWFVDTWNSYGYPIQRADSIRYFILQHYGGIYIDLDNGCKRSLTPLLSYPVWMPGTTNHLGLTQHIMGTVPQHPYFQMLTDSLDYYNYNWLLPYMTIMNSAGPHFVSMVWSDYLSKNKNSTVRILGSEEYAGNPWSFFSKQEGGTWHHWDTGLFRWVGHHIKVACAFCFVLLFGASAGSWWLFWSSVGNWRSMCGHAHTEEESSVESPSTFGKAD